MVLPVPLPLAVEEEEEEAAVAVAGILDFHLDFHLVEIYHLVLEMELWGA